MRTLKIVTIILITLVVVAATALFLIGYLKPKPGGIRIDTDPSSSVFINGVAVGKTPFTKTLDAGEITLRLEPESTSSAKLLAYETKINIAQGIQTVVRREFGISEDLSSGDVISFEKIGGRDVSLVAISTPDNAQISLDGISKGFTPYKMSTITPGSHLVTIKAQGYLDRTLTVNTVGGFQLTIFAKLAKGENVNAQQTPVASPTPAPQVYIQILNTPTGFLRVRTEPGAAGDEIAEIKPGEKYLFLDEDAATGWYKIQYQGPKPGLPNGITGWVSNQFSKKVGSSGEPMATPSATPAL